MNLQMCSVETVPVLPEVASRILSLAFDDEISAGAFADVVEKDQALSARMLSIANSSYYRRSRTIYTVRDAVVAVGLDMARTVCMGLCVMEIFPGVDDAVLDYKEFWRHNMASAFFARAMMQNVDKSLADKAFSVGLLHDIGKLVLLTRDAGGYARVMDRAAEGFRPLVEIEQEMLGTTHAAVGREVLVEWGVPRLYAECVWCHHAPVQVLDEEQYRISGVVHIADILAHLTFSGASGNRYPQRISNTMLRRFDLQPDDLDRLMEQVGAETNAVCAEMGIGRGAEGLFHLVNRASMRLSEVSLQLENSRDESRLLQRRSAVQVRLLEQLNAATGVAEVLERSSSLLMEENLVSAFFGGVRRDSEVLVYRRREGSAPQFVRMNESECRSQILGGGYTAGVNTASGAFVYFLPVEGCLLHDEAYAAALIGAITAALRRACRENDGENESVRLRQALAGASRERQHAEDLLSLSRELVDAALVGLCLVEQGGTVAVENESSRMLRRRLAMGGQTVLAALEARDCDPARTLAAACREGREADVVWEHEEGTVRVTCHPIEVGGWRLLTLWDSTGEIERQRRMLSYARMSAVGSLAGSMAHNMKSPLGAIQGFASIIRDDLRSGQLTVMRGAAPDEDFGDMIDNMLTAAENALNIVNHLLTLTRKWEQPAEDTDLETFVDQTLSVVGSQAAKAEVTLTRSVREGHACIRAQALAQVLINLLSNAIHASSPGAAVHMEVGGDNGRLRFSVRDTGIGIAPEQLAQIFDPLYTSWPSRTGMGLGLSLAKDMVEAMDGSIAVESAPGSGSIFTITL